MRFDQQTTLNQHSLHRFSENQNISFFIALLTFNFTLEETEINGNQFRRNFYFVINDKDVLL